MIRSDGTPDIKNRWLLAQRQKNQTEEVYNKAEKAWYTFSKGGLWYQNYLEDKAGIKIAAKKSNIEDRFNTRAAEIKKLLQVYKEKNDNKNNVGAMDRTIQLETGKLAEKVNFGKNTRNINNRMSDWYEEQNEFYENVNWYVSKIYWISLLVMSALVLIKFKLEAGDIFCFNNRRVMHGRTKFNPNSGHRHLQGYYIDRDEILSRLNFLKKINI